jgi:uncharacterized protein (DUF488 family)
MVKIYTLGTSNRTLEEFLEILKIYSIQTVIDVRRWPTSKWFEHFKKENIQKILEERNIKYFHFEKLGGYREGGYSEYTKTEEFKEALQRLVEVAKFTQTVLICAERLPWKCHRALICENLKEEFEVVHIIEKNKIWRPELEKRIIKPICEKFKKDFSTKSC